MKKHSRENQNPVNCSNIKDEKYNQQLKERLYFEDSGTSLYNKNFFNQNIYCIALQMVKGLAENEKNGNINATWSVMFCDIDGLKLANDTIGHLEADQGIKKIADIIKSCIRTNRKQSDKILYPNINDIEDNLPIRFGGDEFIIILPNCTKDKAILIENRIKKQIDNNKQHTKNMDLSIGISDTTEIKAPTQINDTTALNIFMNQLISLAEKRMYLDKNKDISNLPYDEKKAIMIKHLARIGDNIGFNINNTEDIDMLIGMLNDIKKTSTKSKKR